MVLRLPIQRWPHTTSGCSQKWKGTWKECIFALVRWSQNAKTLVQHALAADYRKRESENQLGPIRYDAPHDPKVYGTRDLQFWDVKLQGPFFLYGCQNENSDPWGAASHKTLWDPWFAKRLNSRKAWSHRLEFEVSICSSFFNLYRDKKKKEKCHATAEPQFTSVKHVVSCKLLLPTIIYRKFWPVALSSWPKEVAR